MNKKLKISFVSFVLIALLGCTSEEVKTLGQRAQVDLSKAIKVNEHLFYIPVDRDNDNCMMHQAYSQTNPTMQAIIYQNGLGRFSMSKDKQSCL
ncbi:hypothetical protein R5P06_01700 [Candidatus Thioglobus autotrophicus]|uniref:hypothetical protein n=1 Tax=Candidatus Thioglobus autotrophicus TaxID=1705394 RepID=UPI00299EB7CD|nr:hypothetical protein [Candidatus Thioglobus autotrophicus]WPE16794.1 hypothetical protein R5P06_01700 [Candidatus Thioglobus autotrophicus]